MTFHGGVIEIAQGGEFEVSEATTFNIPFNPDTMPSQTPTVSLVPSNHRLYQCHQQMYAIGLSYYIYLAHGSFIELMLVKWPQSMIGTMMGFVVSTEMGITIIIRGGCCT